MLDIGCGNGAATLELAKHVGGTIVALDNHQPFLEELICRAQAQGVDEKIKPFLGDMKHLELDDGSSDLVWSEGALYMMGMREGLMAAHRLLTPSGLLGISDIAWLKPDPPEECERFLAAQCSFMSDIATALTLMRECSYEILAHFTLPESAWWRWFYEPLEDRLRRLREKYATETERLEMIESIQVEIDIYRKYSSYYGYVFYRPRPTDLSIYHRFSNGQFDAFVHKERVLEAIADSACQRSDTEIVGRLVGRAYRDDRGTWAVVTDAVLARFTGGPATVATTTEDSAEIVRVLEQDHPSEDLMGWYHSHVFAVHEYSPTDKDNQTQWRKPYHIGLLVVVCADAVTVHAFRGPEGERLAKSYVRRAPEYSCVNDTIGPTLAAPCSALLDRFDKKGLSNLVCLVLWPLAFLLGVHMLADAVAQIRLPVVAQQSVETKLVADKLGQTVDAIGSLQFGLRQQTSEIKQELREIQRLYEQSKTGVDPID